MPKITINLPLDVNEKLKKKAKEDYRSLTNYITIALINLANSSNSPSNILPFSSNNNSDSSNSNSNSNDKRKEKLSTQQQVQLTKQKHSKLYAYFKKKFKSVYSTYMPNPQTLPPAFRPAALNYIFIKYPNELAIDTFIDNELDYVDFNRPDYEFYLYESQIEEREQKLIIPLENNYIYQAIKDYCLTHDLFEVLYHMIEYPNQLFDNLLYFSEINNTTTSFLYDILDDSITEQDIVDAFNWQKDDED